MMTTTVESNTLPKIKKHHLALMRQSLIAKDLSGLIPEIIGLVNEISALGAHLEAEDERTTAQNMLDYWNSTLVALSKGSVTPSLPTELEEFAIGGGEASPSGLNPFRDGSTLVDRNLLLGREDAIRAVIETVSKHAIVFLSGPVGSGRSSLVLAGVVPRLRKANPSLEILKVSLRGDDPIRSLSKITGRARAAELTSSPESFREKIDQVLEARSALIVVDNVDELFTHCIDLEKRQAFAKVIASFAEQPRRYSVILIVREDWIEALCELSGLQPYAAQSARYSPPPPTAAELRVILLGSVQSAGLRIDPHCVDDIAAELQGDPGALSLAWFMLLHLWGVSRGGFIGWDAYQQIGRPNEALANIAERVFETLSPDGKSAAKRLFLSLIKPGVGAGVSIQRESRNVLDEGGRDRGMQEALNALGQAGVIRESSPPESDDDSLEVVHGNLASRWRRLSGWLEVLRHDYERRGRILATARLWKRSGRQSRYLFRDQASIEEAKDYVDTTPDSQALREFINESVHYVERKRRRTLYLIGSAFAFILVTLLGYLALIWYYQTNQKTLISNYTQSLKELVRKENSATSLEAEKGIFTSIHGLRKYGDAPVDLSHIPLHDLDLSDIDLTNSRFLTTVLSNINFSSEKSQRDLTYIPFDDSLIIKSFFTASDLSFSQFLNATLIETSFSNANLFRAAFDNARLCDVNFAGASLEQATFWNSYIDEATIASLGNTAWWLAKGWSVDQLRILSHQDPVEMTQSKAFVEQRKEAEHQIANVPRGDVLARANALNNLAWELATSKVDVASKSSPPPTEESCKFDGMTPSNAQDAATEALCIVNRIEADKDSPTYKDRASYIAVAKPQYQDTLGYILLQSGNKEDALKYLKDAYEHVLTAERGEVLFRLAVAKNASNDPEALSYMRKSLDEMGYVPTHEFGTLKQFLTMNRFGDETDAALGALYPSHRNLMKCR
jgi:hypothetical protein